MVEFGISFTAALSVPECSLFVSANKQDVSYLASNDARETRSHQIEQHDVRERSWVILMGALLVVGGGNRGGFNSNQRGGGVAKPW